MKKNFKYFFLGSVSTLIFISLIFFIVGKENLRDIYWIFHLEIRKIFEKENKKLTEYNFESCLPKLVSSVPKKSSIIIGHAYGRWAKELYGEGLNPKVNKFLYENRNKIDSLFLTGDVFRIPSLAKWKYLYDNFEEYFDIFIAPGNHDVDIDYHGLSRDLFNLYVGSKQSLKFPHLIYRSGFNIVLDDSNIGKTILDSKKNNLNFYSKENSDIVILRHHVMIDKLSSYGGENKKFYNEKKFENRFNLNNKIYFIYGNGGHRANLPRIACYEHSNFTHILNGIGDFNTDNILILNNGNLYRYNLRN